MKKFSIVLSIFAAIAAIGGVCYAVAEYLKRKGAVDEEEEDMCDPALDLEEEPCDENISFSEDEEISFMDEDDKEEEVKEEEPKE